MAILLSMGVLACKKDNLSSNSTTTNPPPTQTGLAQKILGKWTYYKKVYVNGGQTTNIDVTDASIEFKDNGTKINTMIDPQDGQPVIFNESYKIISETSFEFIDSNNITNTCTVSQIDQNNLIYYYTTLGTKVTIYLSK